MTSVHRLRQEETSYTRVSAAETHSIWSKSLIVAVCVSKLGRIDLIFVDAGVKINGAYYHDILLTQKLLSAMREI